MNAKLRSILLIALPLALAACAGVLGIKRKTDARAFEHRAHVLKGVSCLSCHEGILGARDEGALHLPDTKACLRCHEKPHKPEPCGQCHGSPHERSRATMARKHLKFEHRKHVAASKGTCVRCHVQAGDDRPDSMLPPMATCLGCHHHENQFTVRKCEGCHVDLPAEHTMPSTHIVHEGDFVREHGIRAASSRTLCATCHSERFCSSCHGATVPALPQRLAFDKTRLAGLHRAGFRSRHAEEARAQPALCTSCHSESSCQKCHATERVAAGMGARRSPHPPGWVGSGRGSGGHGAQARINPISCASCHGGAGEQLCVGCHRVGGPGGNPHGAGFSSAKDQMNDVPCRYCHAP